VKKNNPRINDVKKERLMKWQKAMRDPLFLEDIKTIEKEFRSAESEFFSFIINFSL
jgi:hypothetical protein